MKDSRSGGTIVCPKTEIADTGWFGIFKGPAVNTLGIYTDMNPD